MVGLVLVAGGIGVMFAAGAGVTSALKWFHTYEADFTKKQKTKGGEHHDKVTSLRERTRPNN